VDIASGSPNSRRPPSYALFILDGDSTATYPMISRHKLIRMIRERQPDMVAMDNLHELASERTELVQMLRRLPASTKLVQVTGGDKPEALTRLARWNGISFNRLNPLEEAEACARLADRGVGAVLSAFEDRTWIKVSRRRSPGRGGWSQNRYSRKIHGAVKGLAREVEKQLRESGLDFTSRAVEGLGGFTRAEFVVDSPRENIHINPGYYCDAQVRIAGIERPKLQFKPLLKRRGYIIVGLDPGTTTGIAALDLHGELVDLVSAREMSSSDVIEWVAARGRPLIVATDVFPTPGAVEKVKRSFSATLYSPGMDVPAEEKITLAREFGYKNDHERDALAAASSAFKKYKNKFVQVDKKVPSEIDPDEVKALVVKGYSIENAISEFAERPVSPEKEEHRPEVPEAETPGIEALRVQSQQLSEQIKTLRSYVDDLKAELVEKDEALAGTRAKMERLKDKSSREVKRDHEIKIRDKEIERLRGLLRSERKYIKKLKHDLGHKKKAEKIEEIKGFRRLKTLEAFSKEAVIAASERWGIEKGDMVFIEDASGGGPNTADLLIDRGIEAIIAGSEMSPAILKHFNDRGLPIFSSREVQIQRIDGIAFVNPNEVMAARARWAERMKIRQAECKAEWLESMIQEYRVERKKEERKKLKQA
jgi:predicted RNase H-like nuclease (RuvC/YqgF family)